VTAPGLPRSPAGPFVVAAVIPARGGSKGVPRKALADLDGEPLIAHTIRAARAARAVPHVIVSTDDAEIAAAAEAAGALVPGLRPGDLSGDEASLEGALRWTLAAMRDRLGLPVDIMITLMPTYPFRDSSLIDQAIGKLIRGRADTVSTWTRLRSRPHDWLERDGEVLRPVITGSMRTAIGRRAVEVYRASGSVNVEWRNPLCQHASWIRGGWLGVPIHGRASIDIDEPRDLAIARAALVPQTRTFPGALTEPPRFQRGRIAVTLPDPSLLSDEPAAPGWLSRGRRIAAWLGDPDPTLLNPVCSRGPVPQGLIECARHTAHESKMGLGSRIPVVIDTRMTDLDLEVLARALDAIRDGRSALQLGLAAVEDHPLLCLVEAGGEGTLLLDRAAVPSFRRQDLKPAVEAAGFVTWRPGFMPPDLASGESLAVDAIVPSSSAVASTGTPVDSRSLASRLVADSLDRLAPNHVPVQLDENLDVIRCVAAA